jgi:hypothetical protein
MVVARCLHNFSLDYSLRSCSPSHAQRGNVSLTILRGGQGTVQMPRLSPRPMFSSFTVSVVVLLLSCTGQARAGMVAAETSPQFSASSRENYWADEQEPPASPCVQAAEPASDRAIEQSPTGLPRDPAALARFGHALPGVPGGPPTFSSNGNSMQAVWMYDRAEHSPSGPAALLLSIFQTQFPNPYLSSLFRPPRCG